MRTIKIFDTTLRDGEQSPGCSMNVEEKVTIAKQGPVICSLAMARSGDIERAAASIADAPRKRIHTFLSTSDIHLEHQFKMTREEAKARAVQMVQKARSYVEDVEFSPMDATRSDAGYLYTVLEAVIDAGAGTINIPDTVGFATPEEFGALIKGIRENVRNIQRAVISVHCHNDLGLAVANSLAAVKNGAGQVECTINGIGERAGNASLEEVVMALRIKGGVYDADTRVKTEEIMKTSRLLTRITGMQVQANKAIVGANAFAHESGIHQDGLLKEKSTYEIISPESVGLGQSQLVMGKHSGRHAFRSRLKEMGYDLNDEEVNHAFERFKKLADQKKEVYEDDLNAIVSDEISKQNEHFRLKSLYVESGTQVSPTATIELETEGKVIKEIGKGDGPVDAVYKTLDKLTRNKGKLLSYQVSAITGGTDAQGEVTVKLEENDKVAAGHGSDTDILIASAKAYLNALNRMATMNRLQPARKISIHNP
ncbi:MAG: 2-isopropylmalate synthase [Nitrospirae bacterium]|nr:2-isopropylmalate synthase [Nitrospirota bacterium]